MALIKCSECNKEISDKATTCPNCGNPIQIQPTYNDNRAVEIELTNKKWKLYRLWGIIILIVGLLSMGFSMALGWCLFFIAIILGCIYRIGAWWNNG